IQVQHTIGAASSGRDADTLALRQWIQEQRANGVTSVSVEVEDGADGAGHDTEGANLLRQMLTGFADGLPFLMRVDTAAGGPV
ncbi:hypothetical protein, partial [Acinetobacter baumannii]|uniref:hypothetical protein n=1 Tax=Acinetobacter baumannii TaxID=470 RepID=UPI00289FD76C